MKEECKPIGFFDSGVGGLSVLKEAVKLLPNENYIYLGDSKNAPYGIKSINQVKSLAFDAVNFLAAKDVKAVVVACNTATSAAIEDLRKQFNNMPVIGIEPALKPAVEHRNKGSIIIMATPMTLSEKKFSNLMKKYEKEAQIQPLPCPGLVELIESGITQGKSVEDYLEKRLQPYLEQGIAAVVLGCTHYPFIKSSLYNILKGDTPVIDGSIGTARQLKRQLLKYKIINKNIEKGNIEIYNSLETSDIIDLSYKLLENKIKDK